MSRRLGALALALVMLWPAVVWPDVITYPARTTIAATLNVNGLCLDAANQDACLTRMSADVLAMKRGTAVQEFRVYGSGTAFLAMTDDGAGNSEFRRNGTGTIYFTPNASLGTGSWRMSGSTNTFGPYGDNLQDLGAAGTARIRSLFLGTSLAITDGVGVAASTVEINRWVVKASGLEINVASGLTLNNVVSVPGASTGTLTNAPGATDPTVWIPIIVNGVVRKIPAW